jgi:hypothetical protein
MVRTKLWWLANQFIDRRCGVIATHPAPDVDRGEMFGDMKVTLALTKLLRWHTTNSIG